MVLYELIHGNATPLIYYSWFAFAVLVLVVISIGLDLYFGIQKSKKNGSYVYSHGFRRTTEKTTQYMAFCVLLFFIDILNPMWAWIDTDFDIPIFILFAGIVLVYTEFKSIREKSDRKFVEKTTKSAKEIIHFVKDNKSLVNKILDEEYKEPK